MKKYKKGFIIMVILLVVVIILAVFGIAYYMGKSSNSSVANLSKAEENLLQKNKVVEDIQVNEKQVKKDDLVKSKDEYGRYVSTDCKIVSGCNGPIECVNKDSEPIVSACVALPEFVCYKKSTERCEKQASGNCGWTYTDTLKACINSYSNKDSRKEGETCGEGIGNCQTGLKCAYPCGVQGCQNVCMPIDELPKP